MGKHFHDHVWIRNLGAALPQKVKQECQTLKLQVIGAWVNIFRIRSEFAILELPLHRELNKSVRL